MAAKIYTVCKHEEIIKNSAKIELQPSEKPPTEFSTKEEEHEPLIEEEKKEEEVAVVTEEKKEEQLVTVYTKEEKIKEKIRKQYDNNISDSENICIPLKEQKTLFEIVVQSLNLNLFRIFKFYCNNKEQFFGNTLIIVINAQIDFLIEFLYTFNYEHEELMNRALQWLFFNSDYYQYSMITYVRKKDQKNRTLSFLRGRIIDLLIAHLKSSNDKEFTDKLSSIEFFNEMINYYNLFLESCNNEKTGLSTKISNLEEMKDEDEYVEALTQLYIWEEQFREDWHMKIIFKFNMLLNLLENKFQQNVIAQSLDNEKERNLKDYIKKKGLYNFLNKILINIEFAYIISDNEREHYFSKEKCDRMKELRRKERIDQGYNETPLDVMRRCLQENIEKAEETKPEEAAQEKYGSTFYNLPYYTYYLTNQSKIRFEENIDRTTKLTKAKGLITYIESFVFEMIVNEYMFKKNTKRAQFVSKFNYFTFELINFAFICIHNIILLVHYYKSITLDPVSYEYLDTNEFNSLFDNKNWLFAVLQLIFLSFVLGVWYKYNYIQCYFNNLQIKYQSKEPLFKRLKKFQNQYHSDNPDFYNLINKHFSHVPYSEKMKVAFLDSIFLNNEICILIYTFLLLILYLIFHSPLCLVIPILFLAHIFDTLSAIFKGVYSRFGHLFAVYIFTYLTIYIFMWTGFLFFSDLFKVDTINSQGDPVSTEPFCSSSIQCLLFFINYGVRSGGGIGDLLGTPSFKDNIWFFMKIFFYEILFHLIIVMIFANVFLGLIADAFGELREAADLKANDIDNICFICQINSDDCAIKGIDFEEHRSKKHNLWDYVNFLCYLYLKDENEYNLMEYKIMSSISEFNLSWIPYAGNEDDS